VVIADDSILLREGVVRLLGEVGFDVVGQSGTADDLLRHVAMHKPDVAIVDIRMPPTHTDEGLRAAIAIREQYPGIGVLVLSQYVELGLAHALPADSAEGARYPPQGPGRDVHEVRPGDAFHYAPGTVHRVTAIEDTLIVEVSTPHLDDVVRLEDRYGREGTSAP